MSQVKQVLEPIYDEESRILILRTFPSVESREVQFYDSNSRNRFWKVISEIFKLYMKYIYIIAKREIVKLPSTSPANAKFTLVISNILFVMGLMRKHIP
ncbi:MAG: hypothetical protein LLF98_00720 [Clostridium sp.]|uniref:hypothetical protein n=1 Tax=Clostridium sp. TaxID=1506 RepID=UPI0025B9702A|nr:hypothetical protein [Clostridium sp.]MCE5219811.1 hypothetical protein [Clostridium sp.]